MESVVLTKEELADWAFAMAGRVEKSPDKATIIALSGDLGAGKTFFTQNLARGLGLEGLVKSPTFVIEKIYDLSGQKWDRLVHIDAYRLDSASDLDSIGWAGVVSDPANLVVLEWPEKVAGALTEKVFHIRFETIDENSRQVTYGQK